MIQGFVSALCQEPDQSSDESTQDSTNGKHPAPVSTDVIDDTTTSFTEDSLDKPSTPTVVPPGDENTNDSIATSDSATNDSTAIATAIITCNSKSDDTSTKRETEEDTTSSLEEPPTKKTKVDGEKWPMYHFFYWNVLNSWPGHCFHPCKQVRYFFYK